jgi:hypothetical protein
MTEYKNGDVYACADPSCHIEVTVTKGCTEEECPTCGPLICCDKPMIKKSSAKKK